MSAKPVTRDRTEFKVARGNGREAELVKVQTYGSTYNPDAVLSVGGSNAYKKMLEDSTVYAGFTLRKSLALSVPYRFCSDENQGDIGKAQADFVEGVLDNLRNTTFLDFLDQLLDAEAYGFSIAEPVWKSEGGAWVYDEIKIKDQSLFYFDTDQYGGLKEIKLRLQAGGLKPEQLIVYVYPYVASGNWYGISCLRPVYRDYAAKERIIKMRNKYLQNRGSAPVMIVYPEGNADAATAAETLGKSLQDDMWCTIPGVIQPDGTLSPNIQPQVIPVATSAGTSEFERAIQQFDAAIMRGLLVPNKIGLSDAAGGSYALGKVQFDVLTMDLQKRLRRLADVVTDQVIKPLLVRNFAAPASVWLEFESLDEEISETKARIVAQLISAGVLDAGEPWAREYLGLPPREDVPVEEIEESVPQDEEPPLLREYHLAQQRYQKPHGAERVKRDFDKIEKVMLAALEPWAQDASAYIVKQAQAIAETNDVKAIDAMTVKKSTGKIRDIFVRGLSEAYIRGKIRTAEAIRASAKRRDLAEPPRATLTLQFNEDDFVRTDWTRATWQSIDKLLEDYGAQLTQANKEYLRMVRDKAYTIAGEYAEDLLTAARKTLMVGVGVKPANQLIAELQTKLGDLTSRAHLLTVVRTNASSQYNLGQVSEALDPGLEGWVKAAQYVAVLDDRTTPFCAAHDGEVIEVTSPEFLNMTPPNHYNCRSFWDFIFADEEYKRSWNTKTDKQLEADGITRATYDKGLEGFGK